MLVLSSVPGAAQLMYNSDIHFACKIVLLSKCIVHMPLSEVPGYRWVFSEVRDACAECFSYYLLGCSVDGPALE